MILMIVAMLMTGRVPSKGIELQVFYEELLARLPEFRLDPTKTLSYHGVHTMRPNEVCLEWEAQ